MAWTTVANLRGPVGPPGSQGAPGPAGADGAQGPQGPQGLQGVSGATGATGPQGVAGKDGKSVAIQGTVAEAAALPTGLTDADAGKGWITDNDGHLHVWGGSSFTDVGVIRGPAGPTGPAGATGPAGPQGATGATGAQGVQGPAGARGTKWFSGSGAPGTISGAAVGDFYLDATTGDAYELT